MPVVIKEMYIRTVIEKRTVTTAEIPDEIVRKIESRVLNRLSEEKRNGQPARQQRRKER